LFPGSPENSGTVTDHPNVISKKGVPPCFKQWQKQWTCSITLEGNYFDGATSTSNKLNAYSVSNKFRKFWICPQVSNRMFCIQWKDREQKNKNILKKNEERILPYLLLRAGK